MMKIFLVALISAALAFPQNAIPYANQDLSILTAEREASYQQDIFWLSWGIFHENRDRILSVQIKTAQVILKRASQRKLSIEEVIKQPDQFTFMKRKKLDLVADVRNEWNAWVLARRIAKETYGQGNFNAFKFNHFYVPSKMKHKISKNHWIRKGKKYAYEDGVVFVAI